MLHSIYNTLSAKQALYPQKHPNSTVLLMQKVADTTARIILDSSVCLSYFRISAVEGKVGMFLDTTVCTN